jgi:hypothetical protein
VGTFARAIQKMAPVIFREIDDITEIHKELIDLVKWSEPPSDDMAYAVAHPIL